MNDHGGEDLYPVCLRRIAVAGAAFSALFIVVLLYYGGTVLTYDEPWYLESVDLIHQHGYSADFLRALPGPAGPLYSVVHYVFEPLTDLAPPLVRWVNPFLLLVAIVAISAAGKSDASLKNFFATAAIFLGIPMTWPCAGMALTEIPAVCAYAIHLLAIWMCLRGGRHHFAWAALAGISLGIAILGRQPLLLGVLPLLYLGLRWPERGPDMILVFAAAMTLVLPVFATWGGLVPPNTAYVAGGLTVRHLILSGGYAAACSLLVCPAMLIWKPALMGGCLVAGIAANMFFQVDSWLPMYTLTTRVIPASLLPLAAKVVYGFVVALSLWLFASCVVTLWRRRTEPVFTFIVLSVMLQVVATMAVKHQFSSRYLETAVPLFAMIALTPAYSSRFPVARLCVGAAIGCVSLINYLQLATTGSP